MRRLIRAVAGLAAFLAAGCGGKGGGTTIVLTTPAATKPASELRTFRVPSGSMEPTVRIGESVFAESSQAPQIGDIIIFYPPKDAAQEVCGAARPAGAACSQPEADRSEVTFIKRVVAGPGDVISIVEGHVIRNGKREPDAYIRPCAGVAECNFPTPIKILAGDWFTMGDNRGESDDSRFWGPVPTSWIVAVVRSCGQLGERCAGP